MMLSTLTKLAVFRPSVTDFGNDLVSARSLLRTPALSRSACSDFFFFFEVGRAAVTSADSLTRGFGAAGT